MAPVQRKGLTALQLWCQQVTASYPRVNVTDLSSSFRDGLAFNAIIHHFRPHLFDFHALDPASIRENNAHAFKVAEEELGIPSLLDPEDMVDCEEPDKFSVATYLAQFYHMFKNESRGTSSPMASPASRTTLTRLSSSDSDNSSMGSSPPSARGTPLATRTTKTFNREDLIAKYGEDIFKSSKESSRENDSLLAGGSGSESSSPSSLRGTPLSHPRTPKLYNREDLIAKYGEDIFSSAPKETPSPKSSPKVPRDRTSPKAVASVCKQFEMKARVSAS